MNTYEQMKNRFYCELNALKLAPSQVMEIGQALDRAAYLYEIQPKETSLAVRQDQIPALVKTYIVVKKTEGLADGTLANYAYILKQFFAWVRKQPEDVVANDIRMFIYDYQQRKKISDRTLDKYREFICWFFHWAYAEEYIPRDPSKSIKGIKHEVKERQFLTQVELEYLRLACNTLRDKAIVEFLYSTGCRVSELIGVKLSDIDWKQNTVHLFGKGKKHRTSFVNAKCEVALLEYLKHRSDKSEYLFVSERAPHDKIGKCTVEKILRELSERSHLTRRITPHMIRHTTATQAANSGMPIEQVSKLLGHANISTTMIYTKVSNDAVHAQHIKCVV